eukprot:6099649-Pleurochrysis_carterae.AAC.1
MFWAYRFSVSKIETLVHTMHAYFIESALSRCSIVCEKGYAFIGTQNWKKLYDLPARIPDTKGRNRIYQTFTTKNYSKRQLA